jgi:putative endonuclease
LATAKSALGQLGEDKAAECLISLGYELVARNYRCKSGEIDIIAFDHQSDCFVFAEVKTRRRTEFSAPSEAVNPIKQRKIIESCRQYLAENNMDEVSCRFDVIEVYFSNNSPIRVSHIPGAFCDEGQALS